MSTHYKVNYRDVEPEKWLEQRGVSPYGGYFIKTLAYPILRCAYSSSQ